MKAIANQAEVVNVLHGVVELSLGEGPLSPIGAGLLFLGRLAQQFGNQRSVAGRVFDAGQAGGELHVEESFGQLLDCQQAELHFAARGMDDGLMVAIDQRLPERPNVVQDDGVDHRQVLRRADLDQAEFRPIGVFGNEFGVQRNPGARGKLLAKLAQPRICRDALVIHVACS